MQQFTFCPCGSNLAYHECCQPFHASIKTPETAEQLMRSRYSAFVSQKIDYIIETTVPAQQNFLDRKAIADWAKDTNWAGLEILNFNPKVDKNHASVEFKAYFTLLEKGEIKQNFHHERSYFVKIGKDNHTKWYFLDPTVLLDISQKQPCICGSGEKFKRCCGKFI